MRLIAFLAAIAVLFCLTDASSAQTAYAGMVASASLSEAQTPTAQAAGLRTLTWPGKVSEKPRARQTYGAQHRIWNPEPPASQAAASQFAAPPPPAPPQAALPANIYAPPPPAAPQPAPLRQAQAARPAMTQANSSSDGDYQPPHFYSLYRQYGQTPDPIPLGPQFFSSATPDLAQPPPPVPHTVTTSGGRVMQSVSPSPDDNPG